MHTHTHTHTRMDALMHRLNSPPVDEEGEEEEVEEEEESWQFDPLDPGGQTHVPELQVPPLRVQDEEHSTRQRKAQ